MDLKKYNRHIRYISEYKRAINASTGSEVDSNANVENKNVTTLTGELFKKDAIGVNRLMMTKKMMEIYEDGEELAQEYIRQLDSHELYRHDETNPLLPYCVSMTMYPFLFNGLKTIGGISEAPKNLQSFVGSFINLVFAVASQFAGAVSTPEFLPYLDYFIRKEYGDEYYKNIDMTVEIKKNNSRTLEQLLEGTFQQVVYSLNQPAAARNFQCVRADTTQLWTPSGYKYLSELKEGDKCYVWKDGKISVDTIEHLNVYDYDGELLQFRGNNYQQTVTPNHRVVYKKTDGSNEFTIKEAREVYGHSKLSLPIAGNVDREDYPISDDLLIACVYALTDGTITKPNDNSHKHASYSLRYYMSPNRKGYEEVCKVLSNLGVGYTVEEATTNQFGDLKIINVPPIEASAITNALENTKEKLPALFRCLSQRQAKLVLKHWSNSNEQKLKSADEETELLLQCGNLEIADMLQEVCMIAGFGSTITKKETGTANIGVEETIYVQTFSRVCKQVDEYEKVYYKGKVWCPSTKTGIVIFREENQTPYISGNSVFWNIAYFDKPYFEGIFENFVFPDGSAMNWDSVNWLQKKFMSWFNKERLKTVLTFPVETLNLLDDGSKYVDDDWADFAALMYSQGHSFFTYRSDSVDSLASCCRLRNEVTDNTFSFTLGAGGVSTGSKGVITLNVNRLVQNATKEGRNISDAVREQVKKIHRYLYAYNEIVKDNFKSGLLTVYNAGYISLEKQFLTIGINGFLEGAEFLGIDISPNEEYFKYGEDILKPIYEENRLARTKEIMFNTEFVPKVSGHRAA